MYDGTFRNQMLQLLNFLIEAEHLTSLFIELSRSVIREGRISKA